MKRALWAWACGEGPDSPINRAFGLVALTGFVWLLASSNPATGTTADVVRAVAIVALLLTIGADWSRVFKWLRRRRQRPTVRVWNGDFTESHDLPDNWRVETDTKEN